MDIIFQMKDVVKTYKGYPAINHADMTIKRGDIYGFVGENGAGKSTVIRLICGLITQTSGLYQLFGVDSKDKKLQFKREGKVYKINPYEMVNNHGKYYLGCN